jgi:O-antigen/teichoic acid export membrane protein
MGFSGKLQRQVFPGKIWLTTDLSYYYLAFSLANIMYLICNAVQNVWMPRFLKEKDIRLNISQTNKLLRRLAIGLVILGLLLIAAFYVALKTNIISEKYWPAIYILPILLLAHIINGIVLLYSNYMVYFEMTHWTLFIVFFTSVIGAVGSFYLVPVWKCLWCRVCLPGGAGFIFLHISHSYKI